MFKIEEECVCGDWTRLVQTFQDVRREAVDLKGTRVVWSETESLF